MNRDVPATATGNNAALTDRYAHALLNTFGPPQRILVRGNGCEVFDADGRRYLDLLAGVAVNALGHAHPTATGAVGAQLSTLGHISNFFSSGPQIGLAEKLLEISRAAPGSRVFFTNSGTESVEAAIKIARRTGRSGLVAAEGAFHGRSTGALALTHKAAYREPFEPLLPGVTHVRYADVDALAAAVDETTAAVVLEPIQGEGGIHPAPPGYLAAARQICTDAGALLILDEIQTGMGRTGAWLAAHREPGSDPDVIVLAKGLGSGFPIGAVIAGPRAADLLGPGSHGTTFGGNPPACAAGLATIHVIERDGLLDHVRELGRDWAADLAAAHPLIEQVRGAGLLLGLQLGQVPGVADPAVRLTAAALEAGFIVNAVTPSTVRLAPPLILSAAQAAQFTAALPGLCEHITRPTRSRPDGVL
ncbi:MAG: acetylornithine aminotransferase [Micrococcales bacterium]|nr:MAG: acetylornithine aminotransferase [Micrococcales bacterium]PIE27854.1 MAG: acetylornithine aminotransferase [Micrococcales bacterium]